MINIMLEYLTERVGSEYALKFYIEFLINVICCLISLSLCILLRVKRKRNGLGEKLFRNLCVLTFLYSMSLFSRVLAIFRLRGLVWIFAGLDLVFLVAFSFVWVLFTDYMIYGSRDALLRRYWKLGIPLALFSIITVVDFVLNLLDVTEGSELGNVASIICFELHFLYYIVAVVVAARYNSRVRKLHFFHVTPMIIASLIGFISANFTDYNLIQAGLTIGLILTYLILNNRWHYDDEESGFYNARYLGKIKQYVDGGKRGYQSAMLISNISAFPAFADRIRNTLPRDMEAVRTGRDSLLLLLNGGGSSVVGMFEKSFKRVDKGIVIKTLYRRDESDSSGFFAHILQESDCTDES